MEGAVDDRIDLEQRMAALRRLSTRERQVLALRATGTSIPEIAAALVIEPRTVKFHLGNIYTKLSLEHLTQGERQLELARYQSILVGLAGADGSAAPEPEGVVAEPGGGALLVVLEDEDLVAPSVSRRRSAPQAVSRPDRPDDSRTGATPLPGPAVPPSAGTATGPFASFFSSIYGGLTAVIAIGAVAAVAVLSTGRNPHAALTADAAARTVPVPHGKVIEGPLSKRDIEAIKPILRAPEARPDRPERPILVPRAPSAPPAPPAPPAPTAAAPEASAPGSRAGAVP
jgi:DNA-binding CsgD family transcriptional regulator